MAGLFYIFLAASSVAVSAQPNTAERLYPPHSATHLQRNNPLDSYLEGRDYNNYFEPFGVKRGGMANGAMPLPRLESLEPDSEVELIPGAQAPRQPPQPNPVAPNVPGLLPGQRVFIVHMPVPGYTPGSIGGYQPVYVVAAGAEGNNRYPGNGYQNVIVVNPTGQTAVSPLITLAQRGVLTSPVLISPFQRPFDLTYPDPQPDINANSGVKTEQSEDHILIQSPGRFPNPMRRLVYQKSIDMENIQEEAPNQKADATHAQINKAREKIRDSVEHKSDIRSPSAPLRTKA